MKTALVTGANRGIGLEICRQLADQGFKVIGVCRETSPELDAATPHIIDGIDVTDNENIKRLAATVSGETLDLIINVAGLLESNVWETLDPQSIERQFQINALGPLRIAHALWKKVPQNGKIVMITSRMGSIKDNTSGGSYGYRMSKAALNMASKSLALDLTPHGIAVGIIHPGYVRTRMTGNNGHIDPPESAKGILQRINELDLSNSGTFWHQNGDILPW